MVTIDQLISHPQQPRPPRTSPERTHRSVHQNSQVTNGRVRRRLDVPDLSETVPAWAITTGEMPGTEFRSLVQYPGTDHANHHP